MPISLWAVVIVIGIIVEAVGTGLVSIWFSVAALCSLILSALGVSELIQWVVFIIVSLFGILLFRNYCMKHINNKIIPTNLDTFIGKEAVVEEEVNNTSFDGVVKVNGQLWAAQSSDNIIEKGQIVKIKEIISNKLIVEKQE